MAQAPCFAAGRRGEHGLDGAVAALDQALADLVRERDVDPGGVGLGHGHGDVVVTGNTGVVTRYLDGWTYSEVTVVDGEGRPVPVARRGFSHM